MTFAHFSLKTRITQVSFGLFSKHKEHCFLISIAPSCISLKKSIGEHFNGSFLRCIWRQSVRKKFRRKYSLFMQDKFICRISTFIQQSNFKSVESMAFHKLLWQSGRKKKVYLPCQIFCHKTVYFTEQEPTKHPIRTEYPIKQKPRDALAREKESTERSPRRGR